MLDTSNCPKILFSLVIIPYLYFRTLDWKQNKTIFLFSVQQLHKLTRERLTLHGTAILNAYWNDYFLNVLHKGPLFISKLSLLWTHICLSSNFAVKDLTITLDTITIKNYIDMRKTVPESVEIFFKLCPFFQNPPGNQQTGRVSAYTLKQIWNFYNIPH